MTLQQLKYVITVAETGTITEAANKQYISQPSLTNAIHELEKELHLSQLDTYFAMARGYQGESGDVKALAMKKWFNTNYHYIVPEIEDDIRLFHKIYDAVLSSAKNCKLLLQTYFGDVRDIYQELIRMPFAGIGLELSTSCSLLHVPYTLKNESRLSQEYVSVFLSNYNLFTCDRNCRQEEVAKRLSQI